MKRFLPVILVLLLVSCIKKQPMYRREAWLTMGTTAALQLPCDSSFAPLRKTSEQVYEEITKNFSAWDSSSVLSQVNHAAGQDFIAVPQAFSSLLERTLKVSEQCGGAFNPLVGPLIDCWGFHGRKTGKLTEPTSEQLQKIMPLIQLNQIVLKDQQIKLNLKGMSLDLGGVAKGYAVDRVWDRFKEKNVKSALIDLGGNLRCIGEPVPGKGGWKTAIRNPFCRHEQAGSFLLRSGEAVATSGNYERFVKIGEKRYAHILDPRTGFPVEGTASVTVISPTAEEADILSTTLFVLGQKEGVRFVQKYAPECDVIWIPDTPESPTLYCSEGMKKRGFHSSWEIKVLPVQQSNFKE